MRAIAMIGNDTNGRRKRDTQQNSQREKHAEDHQCDGKSCGQQNP